MSNSTIAYEMLAAIEAYEQGRASAFSVAAAIELYEPALEGLTRQFRDDLRDLGPKILTGDASPLEQRQMGVSRDDTALNDFRRLCLVLVTAEQT